MSDPISYMPWMVKKQLYYCEMCTEWLPSSYTFCDICDKCVKKYSKL